MALIKCTECGNDVSTTAAVCPNCGAKPKQQSSNVFAWAIGLFLLAFILSRCTSSDTSAVVATPAIEAPAMLTDSTTDAPAAPPAPSMTKGEKEKRIAELTKGFKLNRDKIEKVSFYTAESVRPYNDHLSAYISQPDGSRTYLRVKVDFHADSWIFWNEFKVMSDDEVVYAKDLGRSNVVRDNNTAGVFESADFLATAEDLAALKRIVAAKKSTIRLSGDEKQRNVSNYLRQFLQLV